MSRSRCFIFFRITTCQNAAIALGRHGILTGLRKDQTHEPHSSGKTYIIVLLSNRSYNESETFWNLVLKSFNSSLSVDSWWVTLLRRFFPRWSQNTTDRFRSPYCNNDFRTSFFMILDLHFYQFSKFWLSFHLRQPTRACAGQPKITSGGLAKIYNQK